MKRTLIAAAILTAASGAAFAHHVSDPYIFNATAVSEHVDIDGFVRLFGCVSVSSTVGAVINNTQNVYANVTLDPPPQTYTVGAVTKTFDKGSQSFQEHGFKFAASASAESGSKSFSKSRENSSTYAFSDQASAVSGGGYTFDKQRASNSSDMSHQTKDSGFFVSKDESSNKSFSASLDIDPHSVSGSKSKQESFTASGGKSSFQDAANADTSSSSKSGSGDHSKWSFSADQGSGSRSASEEASGSAQWSKTKSKASVSVWASGEHEAWKNVDKSGTITTYINTQKPGELNAETGAGSGNGASGNIGINVAEGVDNAQSNDASLAAVDVGNVFGNAQIFNTQTSSGTAQINNFMLNASVGENSLQNVSGNVGVNVTAGVGNVQNNSLAASTSSLNPGSAAAVAMAATDQNSQSAAMSFNGTFQGTASLGAGALQNSMGNIGVNIAGGAGNLQHNGLAIAATNMGH